jgi:DNA (cytosine-5)-methyltransferase 1
VKVVDLFAGWGGFSTGAEQAGAQVVWAANHWPLAVRVHQLNHRQTRHECQDLRQADWTKLPRYDLLVAGPSCVGHSNARQPNPRPAHNAMRATAWSVVDCAEVTRPLYLAVENVPQMRNWTLFPLWCEALRALGYALSVQVVSASHCGAPQRRERLFVIGTRSVRKQAITLDVVPTEEPAFGPCIEEDAPGWRPIASCRGADARGRLTTASKRFGRALSHHVTGHRGISLDEPIRTITTKDQWVLVDGDRYRPLTVREYARGMGFPESTTWPSDIGRADAIKGIGNAICVPVAKRVVSRIMAAA